MTYSLYGIIQAVNKFYKNSKIKTKDSGFKG